MAVYREAPKCPHCGEDIKAIHKDESHLPWYQQIIGDTFIEWDFRGHKCKNISSEKPIEMT